MRDLQCSEANALCARHLPPTARPPPDPPNAARQSGGFRMRAFCHRKRAEMPVVASASPGSYRGQFRHVADAVMEDFGQWTS